MELQRVAPLAFLRPTIAGRTSPSILLCERPDKTTVEVVAKFSAGCFSVEGLVMEALCACLAAGLGLPVPEPLLVEVPPGWAGTIPDISRREIIEKSNALAFGSRLVTQGYHAWHSGSSMTDVMLPTVAAIFAFDAIIQNPDRRLTNPNCLVRGNDLIIFDHELAFTQGSVIGWKPPWILGGLESMRQPGNHIFRDHLKATTVDFSGAMVAWKALSDDHLQSYLDALPREWGGASAQAVEGVELVCKARDKFEDCLKEIARVLQ